MVGGAYARVVAGAVAAAPRYWASRPCRARPRSSCGRPVDPGGRRCGIPGDTVFVEPGSYAEPGIACPANPALTCGVAIAKDGISLIGLMHGRRQVGCRPLGAAPLKCAVCGTVVSWPNGKTAASQTCPVRWPTSRPLDARTGRSVPLAHDEPGIDRQRVFGVPSLGRDSGCVTLRSRRWLRHGPIRLAAWLRGCREAASWPEKRWRRRRWWCHAGVG